MWGIARLHGGHQYSKHSIMNGCPFLNSDILLSCVNPFIISSILIFRSEDKLLFFLQLNLYNIIQIIFMKVYLLFDHF